jgi:hypothetical protein
MSHVFLLRWLEWLFVLRAIYVHTDELVFEHVVFLRLNFDHGFDRAVIGAACVRNDIIVERK